MNTVNPDQSPIKVLGQQGFALVETTKAILTSVDSAVTGGLKPLADIFGTASPEQTAKVARDNVNHRNSGGLSLSPDDMFNIGDQSIVANIGKRNVDTVGPPEGMRAELNTATNGAIINELEAAGFNVASQDVKGYAEQLPKSNKIPPPGFNVNNFA